MRYERVLSTNYVSRRVEVEGPPVHLVWTVELRGVEAPLTLSKGQRVRWVRPCFSDPGPKNDTDRHFSNEKEDPKEVSYLH